MERSKEDGAILWHCSEGKDRCGLVSALILKILNVDESIIFEDYLETNKTNLPKAERVYQELLNYYDEDFAYSIYRALIADEKYLQCAFDTMGDYFFEDKLKLDPSLMEEFRKEILI